MRSIWSANAGMKALFDALNVAYGEKETRGFIKLNATSLAFTAGMLMFAVVALAAAVGVPLLLAWLPLGEWLALALRWLRWPLLLVLLGVLFGAMAVASDTCWALAASRARDWFARKPERLDTLGAAGGVHRRDRSSRSAAQRAGRGALPRHSGPPYTGHPERPRPRADRERRRVAQSGRAPVSKTGGWGFESLRACKGVP